MVGMKKNYIKREVRGRLAPVEHQVVQQFGSSAKSQVSFMLG